MDIQRIIDTDIPDIAPVYGGVRGGSMSSKGLGIVWPTINEAGVKTVVNVNRSNNIDWKSVGKWVLVIVLAILITIIADAFGIRLPPWALKWLAILF